MIFDRAKKFLLLQGSGEIYLIFILGLTMIAAALISGGFGEKKDSLTKIKPTRITGIPANDNPDIYEPDISVDQKKQATPSPLLTPSASESALADLAVTSLNLTDINGNEKTVFAPGERIYPKVTLTNQGTKRIYSSTGFIFSQIYAHQPQPAKQGQKSDVKVWMKNGLYDAGSTKTYEARPNGVNDWFFKENHFWTLSTPGTYTARAYINYDHDGVESDYTNNQTTITYRITNKPTPTPSAQPTQTTNTQSSSVVENINTSPNGNTCGKYSLNNPMGKNFGDPNCNFTKDKLYSWLKTQDAANADYWFYTVIPCEAPGYNPNTYYRCGAAGCTPDPAGAWGLFQMGRGRNGPYDHGDVNWPAQVINATTYRRNLGWYGWTYWACAKSRW
jgi:hypothetical protein